MNIITAQSRTKNITDCIIDQQYADNIGFVISNINIIYKALINIAPISRDKNLTVDDYKSNITYNTKNTKNDWRMCKYIGTSQDM